MKQFCETTTMISLQFFLIISLAMVVSSRPEPNSLNKEDLQRLWYAHRKLVSNFTCGTPQQRSFAATEILGDELLSSESSLPTSTVLYRCDSQSGCCTNINYACGPLQQEPVTLIFRTIDRLTSKAAYKPVLVYNHTLCGCQIRNDTPKR